MEIPEVITVHSNEELRYTVSTYVDQGFEVIAQSPTSVTLIKRKQFQILYAVLALFCIIPLLVYLFSYANQKEPVIEIRLVPSDAVGRLEHEPASPAPAQTAPPGAGTVPPQLAPDGTHWWDGTQWHRVPS